MAVARLTIDNRSEGAVGLSDEIELYQRTYNTLLRSSGETHLRVLEPSHRAIGSSLHPLAASDEVDLVQQLAVLSAAAVCLAWENPDPATVPLNRSDALPEHPCSR